MVKKIEKIGKENPTHNIESNTTMFAQQVAQSHRI